jgi:hypothetical protein
MQSYQINDDQIKALKSLHSMEAQPFYVVDDEAYNRMMTKLKGGAAFVKSFKTHTNCPHAADCTCEFYKNYLDKDGIMVRNCGGSIKDVISISALKKLLNTV